MTNRDRERNEGISQFGKYYDTTRHPSICCVVRWLLCVPIEPPPPPPCQHQTQPTHHFHLSPASEDRRRDKRNGLNLTKFIMIVCKVKWVTLDDGGASGMAWESSLSTERERERERGNMYYSWLYVEMGYDIEMCTWPDLQSEGGWFSSEFVFIKWLLFLRVQ